MSQRACGPERDIPVVILCGGEGTRFHEESQYRPKPLAEIGGWPILCHIMQIYARHGFKRFILCLGYKGGMIKDFFLKFETHLRDFSLRLDGSAPSFLDGRARHDWEVSFVDTGAKTMTGARIKRVAHLVRSPHFMVTYGDGLADIDLDALVDYHLSHGAIGTVTGVQSSSQFGVLRIEDDRVTAFPPRSPRSRRSSTAGSSCSSANSSTTSTTTRACVARTGAALEAEPGRSAARVPARRVSGSAWIPSRTTGQLNEIWADGVRPGSAPTARAAT